MFRKLLVKYLSNRSSPIDFDVDSYPSRWMLHREYISSGNLYVTTHKRVTINSYFKWRWFFMVVTCRPQHGNQIWMIFWRDNVQHWHSAEIVRAIQQEYRLVEIIRLWQSFPSYHEHDIEGVLSRRNLQLHEPLTPSNNITNMIHILLNLVS